jgi:CBS domain-containing protein
LRDLSVAQACQAVQPVPAQLAGAELHRVLDGAESALPVVDARGFAIGVLPVRDAKEALSGSDSPSAEQLARTGTLVLLHPDDDLQHALHALSDAHASEAVVVESLEAPRPVGVVTREAILDAWHRANR